METGEPYIMFGDTVDEAMPEFQKKLGLKVHQSNLCSEITLPTEKTAQRYAVCHKIWKNMMNGRTMTRFIPDLIRMLDNVLEYFINHAPDQLHRAKYSASQERSLG